MIVGKWLGFHGRAALPFGFAPNSVGAARRMAGTLRVGIVGAGWAGESHVAAYSRLSGVEVTGYGIGPRRGLKHWPANSDMQT
jgi:hypothetical protein